MEVKPSSTGVDPILDDVREEYETVSTASTDLKGTYSAASTSDFHTEKHQGHASTRPIDRERSRKLQRGQSHKSIKAADLDAAKKRQQADAQVPTLWITYCHMVTFWCPNAVLRCFGKPQKAQQRAWREKMGLLSIIALIMAFVGFLTFGFTAAVCPASAAPRLRINNVGAGYLIIHGKAYDLTRSRHPYARGVPDGVNVLYMDPSLGGYDASFMFQNVNGHCKGLINAVPDTDVPTNSNGDLAWYMPCSPYKQDGSTPAGNWTITPYYTGYGCHLSSPARSSYYGLHASSDVYFTWDDMRNDTRNLAVFGSDVLDLNLLEWLDHANVTYPPRFNEIRQNPEVRGTDLTLAFSSNEDKQIARCLSEIVKVGTVDTETIGCIASKVVLYVSLAFILSIVAAKFILALTFQWFLSKKYAATKGTQADSKKRNKEIEDWTDDIYRPPPKFDDAAGGTISSSARTSAFLPTSSRFTSPYNAATITSKARPQPTTMASQSATSRLLPPPGVSDGDLSSRDSRLSYFSEKPGHRGSGVMADPDGPGPAGFIHEAVVPQPPPEWQPFGYPLAHTICLVTAYSEGADGIRTTLDSVATTEYPNSHKLLLVICDGLIKGSGEEFTTPEIVLGMMKDHTILPNEVQPFSYVAVASGSKRHNMAKIYSGFYDYGENSDVPHEAQQRVPMMLVVKCGTPDEANKAKPGNRGKRDSQIILMSFLQKVMFDERMTELEYEMFNGIWKITGISPDFYETVLMVDADTKVFPDSVTHMMSAMIKDPEIMGLCGETKIANKRTSWVTAIQVFEYFISHHQAKSFESVFGGVTCLPGCFSMYRIKSPKGGQNYWVPILANPDIVEHYSENVVDTLHKKNLLLLGEDRYLSTLMLRTFPKRKQIFVPQAICKTTVPDTFKVLLSQRRRWINTSPVISSVIDGVRHLPIPVIPLVLLGLILGLPGFLIVLTAHKLSYVIWMLIYLCALPIWNGILPAYAYWKFDDFSWGDTRKTAGEKTRKAGIEYEGEFDSTKITMKRWGEFEQERRLKGPSAYSQRASTAGISPPGWQQQSRTSYMARDSYHE
ncbi:hypothetical protein FH972_026370 [Carpinus fangiana]|uniref:chitin synthase n=1 Tax=Carpinus fangiana TaxID=176857 RepID=A0A5N6L4R8_9ROSI|nr:hypothetical protein FH972_026370 [Carpinus fangiana]